MHNLLKIYFSFQCKNSILSIGILRLLHIVSQYSHTSLSVWSVHNMNKFEQTWVAPPFPMTLFLSWAKIFAATTGWFLNWFHSLKTVFPIVMFQTGRTCLISFLLNTFSFTSQQLESFSDQKRGLNLFWNLQKWAYTVQVSLSKEALVFLAMGFDRWDSTLAAEGSCLLLRLIVERTNFKL